MKISFCQILLSKVLPTVTTTQRVICLKKYLGRGGGRVVKGCDCLLRNLSAQRKTEGAPCKSSFFSACDCLRLCVLLRGQIEHHGVQVRQHCDKHAVVPLHSGCQYSEGCSGMLEELSACYRASQHPLCSIGACLMLGPLPHHNFQRGCSAMKLRSSREQNHLFQGALDLEHMCLGPQLLGHGSRAQCHSFCVHCHRRKDAQRLLCKFPGSCGLYILVYALP